MEVGEAIRAAVRLLFEDPQTGGQGKRGGADGLEARQPTALLRLAGAGGADDEGGRDDEGVDNLRDAVFEAAAPLEWQEEAPPPPGLLCGDPSDCRAGALRPPPALQFLDSLPTAPLLPSVRLPPFHALRLHPLSLPVLTPPPLPPKTSRATKSGRWPGCSGVRQHKVNGRLQDTSLPVASALCCPFPFQWPSSRLNPLNLPDTSSTCPKLHALGSPQPLPTIRLPQPTGVHHSHRPLSPLGFSPFSSEAPRNPLPFAQTTSRPSATLSGSPWGPQAPGASSSTRPLGASALLCPPLPPGSAAACWRTKWASARRWRCFPLFPSDGSPSRRALCPVAVFPSPLPTPPLLPAHRHLLGLTR